MGRTDWETPDHFIDFVEETLLFNFSFDVCANDNNAKCANYFTPEDDALSKEWPREPTTCWMNPPYGREIGEWLNKAYEEAKKGSFVVALVPNSTDTDWFHDEIFQKADSIFLLRGRIQFVGGNSSPPYQGSILVVYGNYDSNPYPHTIPFIYSLDWRSWLKCWKKKNDRGGIKGN